MVMKEKVILSWSGGKDSALAFYELEKTESYEIAALLTTVAQECDRISMHGVQRILLERQAECLGFPLEKVFISKDSSNEDYKSKMREVLAKYVDDGVSCVVFGDIFLEEVRKHREENLSKMGMKGIFPIWRRDTRELAHTFIDLGFSAVITCVDSSVLDKTFIGRAFDESFLSQLPSTVDPCGENGEYHTLVIDGPIFNKRIEIVEAVTINREGFWFLDTRKYRLAG